MPFAAGTPNLSTLPIVVARLAEPPPADWSVYKNLGIAYDRLRRLDPGLLAKRDEAWRVYLRLAPATDSDRAAVAAAVGEPAY